MKTDQSFSVFNSLPIATREALAREQDAMRATTLKAIRKRVVIQYRALLCEIDEWIDNLEEGPR